MSREKIESLKDLSDLLDKGRITPQEYEAQKTLMLKPAGYLGNVVSTSKILTPQAVVLLIVAAFYFPLLSVLPKASELGFGGFAVKLEQATKIFGDKELVESLKSLSKEETITLLNSGKGYYNLVYVDDENKEVSLDSRYEYYVSLEEKGLIDVDESLEEFRKILSSKTSTKKTLYEDLVLGNLDKEIYSIADFSSEELKRANELSVRLSVRGLKIYSLIVDLAAEEISTVE